MGLLFKNSMNDGFLTSRKGGIFAVKTTESSYHFPNQIP